MIIHDYLFLFTLYELRIYDNQIEKYKLKRYRLTFWRKQSNLFLSLFSLFSFLFSCAFLIDEKNRRGNKKGLVGQRLTTPPQEVMNSRKSKEKQWIATDRRKRVGRAWQRNPRLLLGTRPGERLICLVLKPIQQMIRNLNSLLRSDDSHESWRESMINVGYTGHEYLVLHLQSYLILACYISFCYLRVPSLEDG